MTYTDSTRRATHEELVKTHKPCTKRQRASDSDLALGSSVPCPSSASNTARSTLKANTPLQSQYPSIRLRTKLDWKKYENKRKDSTEPNAIGGQRGGTRSSMGENVMMLYVENADGTTISGTCAGEIREFARSIWRDFYSRGIAPKKWGDAS